ncbi:hypothetical protein H5410_055958, partial [Solanum commersonii]
MLFKPLCCTGYRTSAKNDWEIARKKSLAADGSYLWTRLLKYIKTDGRARPALKGSGVWGGGGQDLINSKELFLQIEYK